MLGSAKWRSPIYRTRFGYDLAMRALYGRGYERAFVDVARLIPDCASVVDLCCGTGGLFRFALRDRCCAYSGYDVNHCFIAALRRAGIDAHYLNVAQDQIPTADYVVVVSSFYHFHRHAARLVSRLKAASNEAVIISEPIDTLSRSRIPLVGALANALTNPGIGDFSFRYDLNNFRALIEAHGATEFIHRHGERNAIAVFRT